MAGSLRVTIPEDVVEYSVFPFKAGHRFESSALNELESYQIRLLSAISSELTDYIWQNESFHLVPMDQELAATNVGKSFERGGSLLDEENPPAINVEATLVKNLLESYSSQRGEPGPTSTLLHSVGVTLPANADSENSER